MQRFEVAESQHQNGSDACTSSRHQPPHTIQWHPHSLHATVLPLAGGVLRYLFHFYGTLSIVNFKCRIRQQAACSTQVAAPTTPSLCKASHAQLNIGSAGIYLPTISGLCLAAISAPTTTLAISTAPPAPSTSWRAAFAWRSCPTALRAA